MNVLFNAVVLVFVFVEIGEQRCVAYQMRMNDHRAGCMMLYDAMCTYFCMIIYI